jgi:hypothetical protein
MGKPVKLVSSDFDVTTSGTTRMARQANTEAGMTTEKTVTIAVGVVSCVAAALAAIPAVIKLRRR